MVCNCKWDTQPFLQIQFQWFIITNPDCTRNCAPCGVCSQNLSLRVNKWNAATWPVVEVIAPRRQGVQEERVFWQQQVGRVATHQLRSCVHSLHNKSQIMRFDNFVRTLFDWNTAFELVDFGGLWWSGKLERKIQQLHASLTPSTLSIWWERVDSVLCYNFGWFIRTRGEIWSRIILRWTNPWQTFSCLYSKSPLSLPLSTSRRINYTGHENCALTGT